jgi:hypothetical protein
MTLPNELKAALLEHDDVFSNKPSRMPFGAHRGKTLRDIHAFLTSIGYANKAM